MEMRMAIIVEAEMEAAIEEDEVVSLPSCKDQVLWIIFFRYLCAHIFNALITTRVSYHLIEN